ncbi:hypothetical protein AK812_SmicGene46920 [Symbiodinium microadriaticum]|uniref:Uncharacterized protein n=1 Tax=Symbiodinium microadriaticum TaxID=2951 RepID=A0A1Q9BT16_SYMMI|nr:hypothetical protein AK812_SmicGene46920 [Symbiodinium microadriaticum]
MQKHLLLRVRARVSKIWYVDLPSQKQVPYVLFSDWVKCLGSSGRLHYLVGVKDTNRRQELFSEFWRRLEQSRPGHPVFQLAREGKIQLKDTFPVLHHGDEGRSYKKAPIMIISTHGLLGAGSAQTPELKKHCPVSADPMRLNFLGCTLTTHFIFAALPSSIYKNNPDCLDRMLQLYAADMQELTTTGVTVMEAGVQQQLFFACVACKGDLPYLSKSGHFLRTYSMCAKQATSRAPCKGICFRCQAGVETKRQGHNACDAPWEDFGDNASWMRTEGPSGIGCSSPLLAIPHDTPENLFQCDLWHNFHLGAGKSFVVNAVVALLEAEDGCMDDKLALLGADYRSYCKRMRVYSCVTSITRDLLGWQHANDMPSGGYHKGFLTTRLLEWLEDFMGRRHKDTTDPYLIEIVPLDL